MACFIDKQQVKFDQNPRSQCCGKKCEDVLANDPRVKALRDSLDAMDNDEKNSTLMSLLTQVDKKDWVLASEVLVIKINSLVMSSTNSCRQP